MFCDTCGNNNLTDAQFCKNCGRPIARDISHEPSFQKDENHTTVLTSEDTPEIFSQVHHTNSDNWMNDPVQYTPADPRTMKTKSKTNGKSKKKVWITLTCVLLSLILLGSLGFVFRLKILKMISPEKYLQLVMVRTLSLAEKEQASILNLNKYDGNMVSQVFSFEVDEMNIDGSLTYDSDKDESLIDVSVDDGTNTYEDNQLYLSPSTIAIAIPDVVADTDYLTLDMGNIKSVLTERQIDKVFSVDQPVDEKIGGQSMHLNMMTYTFSESDINDYCNNYIETFKDAFSNPDVQDTNYTGNMDYFFEVLNNIDVKDDVEIHLYIDKNDYIRKIVLDNLTVSGDNFDATCDMEVLFEGTHNPTDTISILISSECGGETYEIDLNREENYNDGIYSEVIELEASGSRFVESFTLSADVKWDKNKESGENLELQMNGGTENNTNYANLTGTLIDSNEETYIDNAILVITDSYGSEKTISFDTSIKNISKADISFDSNDSIPLMEYKPFVNYFHFY